MPLLPERLTTARLDLRVWRESDAEALRAVLDANDAHLRPWLPFMRDEPRSLAETRARCADKARWFATDEHHRYAIFERASGTLVGETMLLNRGGERTREIGYWLAQTSCGRGYVTEATAPLPDLAFAHLDADRVILRCDERNAASLAVAGRLGAVAIGTEVVDEFGCVERLIVLERRRPSRG